MTDPVRSPPSARSRLEEPPPPLPAAWVLYVDLDAYYVACELRDRPDLKGRPVIVGPPPSAGPTRGVVLSASYEARPFGVRSALPVAVAARLCPDALWIPPDFPKYERVAREVRALLRRYVPTVIPYSIDEAALLADAPDARGAEALARSIQAALRDELGLSGSFGVATSRVVAKMASERAKPGGVVVVPPERVAEFVAPLPLRAVPGVGPKTEAELERLGLHYIGELAGRRPRDLAREIGGFALELVALARGTPIEGAAVDSGPRSRSADHTFATDETRWTALEPAVRALADRLASDLDREGLRYGTVGIALRWSDFERSQRSRALPAAREGAAALVDQAVRLAHQLWDEEQRGARRPVRTASVRVERLTDRHQLQAVLEEFAGDAPDPSPNRRPRSTNS